MQIVSRPYRPDAACEKCVFGSGEHTGETCTPKLRGVQDNGDELWASDDTWKALWAK